MITIAYICNTHDDLAPGHNNGAEYSIETAYSAFEPITPKHIRNDVKALTGRLVSIYHRTERYYRVSYNKVPMAALEDWREFRDSTRFGSASPFSIDATTVPWIGTVLENLVMIDPPDLPQHGTTQFFEVAFKFYRQPD